jgi:HPt (histidine-containing phosphotransfer) domain-containing protein
MEMSLTNDNGGSPAILDRAGAIKRLGGDEEIFDELLELLLEDAPTQVAQITDAVGRGDAERVACLAHNLKGGAASMGADRVRDAAYRLETIGYSSNLSEAPSALAHLEQEVDLLRNYG